MPRIGFVTTSFPRFSGDTAGSFVFGMARALRRLDIEIEVVAPEPPDTADWESGAPWLEGVRVLPFSYVRPRRISRLFYGGGVPDNIAQSPWLAALVPAASASMVRTVARALPRWDASISHWLLPSTLAVAAASALTGKRHLPHLAVAHSGDVHLLSTPPFRLVARLLPRCASDLGFISDNLRRRFLSLLGAGADRAEKKTCIAPMGIDLDSLQTSKPRDAIRKALGLSGFTVLFLGRMVPIKGLDVLIDALARVPDIALIAAGDGPLRDAYRRLAKERGVNARFVGAVDASKRAELLTACDALVLSSVTLKSRRTEGLPLVILEAMAAGLPVVAADTGSVSEDGVHGRTGLLFDEGNSADLARVLRLLCDDADLRDHLRTEAGHAAASREWNLLAEETAARLLPASFSQR